MELCSHNKKDGVIVAEGFKHEQWRWGAEDGANRQLACHSCLKGWRERGTLRKGHKGAWWRCGSAVSCSPAHMFSATRAHVKANVRTLLCSWKPRKTSGSYKATARLRGQTGRKPPNSSSTRARTGRQMHFHCSLCLSAVPSWDSLRPLFSHPFLIALLLFVLVLCTFVVVSAFSFPSCAHLACRITSKVLLFPSFGLFLFVMVVLSPRPSFHIRAWPAALLLTPVGGILTFLCGSSSFFVVWEFPCASFGFSFFFLFHLLIWDITAVLCLRRLIRGERIRKPLSVPSVGGWGLTLWKMKSLSGASSLEFLICVNVSASVSKMLHESLFQTSSSPQGLPVTNIPASPRFCTSHERVGVFWDGPSFPHCSWAGGSWCEFSGCMHPWWGELSCVSIWLFSSVWRKQAVMGCSHARMAMTSGEGAELLQLFISSEHSVQIQLEVFHHEFDVYLMDSHAFLNKECNYSLAPSACLYLSLSNTPSLPMKFCSRKNDRCAKQVKSKWI